jgi:2,3-bisphosphoglycerate-independent phosphoglycerate mutase
MPDEFIRWRHFFRDNGLIAFWRELYNILTKEEKRQLLKILCDIKSDRTKITKHYTKNIDTILKLYTINKSQFERGEITTNTIIKQIKKVNVQEDEFSERNTFIDSSIRCPIVLNNRI